jgi:hypothetical protein
MREPVDILRLRADQRLQEAEQAGSRERARKLVIEAHNLLKAAEEEEALRLNARG